MGISDSLHQDSTDTQYTNLITTTVNNLQCENMTVVNRNMVCALSHPSSTCLLLASTSYWHCTFGDCFTGLYGEHVIRSLQHVTMMFSILISICYPYILLYGLSHVSLILLSSQRMQNRCQS